MDNPFDTVEVAKKPRIKRKFTIDQMFNFFPEESEHSIIVKEILSTRILAKYPDIKQFPLFKLVQMLFNKYFYSITFPDEQNIDEILTSITEFELFKTI